VPTNRTEDGQDLPDTTAEDETDDSTPDSDEEDVSGADAGPLQRSHDALEQGRDAAHEALKDRPPDDEALGH
jgi:hypothetical protein